MLRVLFISLLVLLLGFFFLRGRLNVNRGELPPFLRTDNIARAHQTTIRTTVHSMFKPDSVQLQLLEKDYSNIWAHLNHLYATNDVEAGKEYYTEDWFRQLCLYYQGIQKPLITREDKQHELHIQNWSSDGLICTAIDSNVVFNYSYPDKHIEKTNANIALVLLYQGDHWQIDSIRDIS